jgi:hypothetical protein
MAEEAGLLSFPGVGSLFVVCKRNVQQQQQNNNNNS